MIANESIINQHKVERTLMTDKSELFKTKTSQLKNLKHFTISILILFGYFGFQIQILNSLHELFSDLSTLFSLPSIDLKMWMSFIVLLYPTFTLWKVLVVHFEEYTFNFDRLIITSGVINRKSDYLEYYRIKDYTLSRSLIERVFGLCTLCIISTDRTNPLLKLSNIKNFTMREPTFRDAIDVTTASGKGRELDIV